MISVSNKKSFLTGLCFVACAYGIIKVLDHYQWVYHFMSELGTVLTPFLMAFVFAYLFNPVVTLLEKRGRFKRGMSLTCVYGGFISLCILVGAFIWPILYQNALDLMKQLPLFATTIQEQVNHWGNRLSLYDLGEFNEFRTQLLNLIPQLTQLISASMTSILSFTYTAILGTGNLIFGFIVSLYILLEKESFLEMTKRLIYVVFRPTLAQPLLKTVRLIHVNIGKYLIGKAIDSTFIGVLVTIGLAVIGSKYAVLLGFILGLTNMIPFVGPIFGTVIAVGVNLFYSPMTALFVLIYLLVLQQIETFLIEPKIVGEKIGLNPFFTLLAVTLGGKLLGIVGMILGVPIMGIIKEYSILFINHHYQCIKTEPLND